MMVMEIPWLVEFSDMCSLGADKTTVTADAIRSTRKKFLLVDNVQALLQSIEFLFPPPSITLRLLATNK